MTPAAQATEHTTVVRVDEDVYARLLEIKQEVENETGRTATMNDALWRILKLDKTVDLYAGKPRLRHASERGYNARVMGAARQANPYRRTDSPQAQAFRKAWFDGWDLADERSKGHQIFEAAP